MAPQPRSPAGQPPPDLPSMPDVSGALTDYLRTFGLWCRNMFQDKLDAHRGLPGVMLQAYDVVANNPPVYLLEVNAAGRLMLVPMALGSGKKGAPVPANAMGVTDGSNAPAGQVGEYVSAGATVALTNNVVANVVVMSLTAGDWDVEGLIQFTSSTSVGTAFVSGVSTVSATFPNVQPGRTQFNGPASINIWGQPTGAMRVSLAAAASVYLVGLALFASGTCSAQGVLRARRMR